MKKKYLYVKPELEVVELKEPLMLELPVSNVGVNDEAAKEQGDFETDETVPASPNLWGDSEEDE